MWNKDEIQYSLIVLDNAHIPWGKQILKDQ